MIGLSTLLDIIIIIITCLLSCPLDSGVFVVCVCVCLSTSVCLSVCVCRVCVVYLCNARVCVSSANSSVTPCCVCVSPLSSCNCYISHDLTQSHSHSHSHAHTHTHIYTHNLSLLWYSSSQFQLAVIVLNYIQELCRQVIK